MFCLFVSSTRQESSSGLTFFVVFSAAAAVVPIFSLAWLYALGCSYGTITYFCLFCLFVSSTRQESFSGLTFFVVFSAADAVVPIFSLAWLYAFCVVRTVLFVPGTC